MAVEHGDAIKFLSDEDVPLLEIIQRLKEHCEERALSQSQVYYWTRQVKLGRTNLAKIASPGRPPDPSGATVTAHQIERDPHLLARSAHTP
jgi:hypothetical protein